MVLWQLETHWRGYEGYRWMEYLHVAIPIGICLLLIWILLVNRKRDELSLKSGAVLVIGYILMSIAMTWLMIPLFFITGPSGVFLASLFGLINHLKIFLWIKTLLPVLWIIAAPLGLL